MKVGVSLGLPAYSSCRVEVESDGPPGESMEATAERLSGVVWARLRVEAGKAVAACADARGFAGGADGDKATA